MPIFAQRLLCIGSLVQGRLRIKYKNNQCPVTPVSAKAFILMSANRLLRFPCPSTLQKPTRNMAAGFTGERQFTWCSFFISLVISSGVLSFGYPTAILGTTFSQPSFLAYMGLVNGDGITTSRVQALIGATSGVYQVRSLSQQVLEDSLTKVRAVQLWESSSASGSWISSAVKPALSTPPFLV